MEKQIPKVYAEPEIDMEVKLINVILTNFINQLIIEDVIITNRNKMIWQEKLYHLLNKYLNINFGDVVIEIDKIFSAKIKINYKIINTNENKKTHAILYKKGEMIINNELDN